MARILVVDDEGELRVSVARILRRAGHDVDTAGTGELARSRLERAVYDLVITDCKLPDTDGIELLQRTRAAQPDAKVLTITAFGNIPLAVDAIKQGAWARRSRRWSASSSAKRCGRPGATGSGPPACWASPHGRSTVN